MGQGIAKCRYKTKIDKHSGFWQVDLTAAAEELLAFITLTKGRVFKWKVMLFGVANAPAVLQELMNKILYILRRRPLVQELISRGAEMEAHIYPRGPCPSPLTMFHCLSRKPSPNQTRKM